MNQHRDPLPPIQFSALADALLRDAENLVPRWLPGGSFAHGEYKCADLSGGHGGSCSVNVRTGKWSDFATGEAGNDLISLYGAIHGLSNAKAAIAVAREERLEDIAGLVKTASGAPVVAAENPRPKAEPKPAAAKDGEKFETLLPVPEYAPAATFAHFHRKPEDLVNTADYRLDGQLLGYVLRYRKSDGGKDTIPYTFARSTRDGSSKWVWKQWDEPRPLYMPGHSLPAGRTVVLVEGEVKAQVLQQLLDAAAPGIYCVCSWPGGSKAWQKAQWAWLANCTVLLWPDCDAQRERLTRAEQEQVKGDEAAKDALQATKPLLPEHKQPGIAAMLGIGTLLRDAHGCTVQLLPIPKPGEKPSGWDCKDAIVDDGWTAEDVLAFFGKAQPLPVADGKDADADVPTDAAGPAGAGGGAAGGGGGKPPKKRGGPVGTGGDGDDSAESEGNDAWLWHFYDRKKQRWDLRRSLVAAALQNDPRLMGCVAYNEMTNGATVRRVWPWKHGAEGDVERDSVLLLGRYLDRTYGVGDISELNLESGIDLAAYEDRYHPVRQYLSELAWDGKPRLDKWLIHALQESPETLTPQMSEYLKLVGRYWVMGMVWRVMEPGCKFDYCPVLEGKGGLRKSTLVEVLAVRREWWSDTRFDLSKGKDAFEQVRGKWLYEIGELSSFTRADVNDIKAFISSKEDHYRVSYGRKAQGFPRQCLLAGSTNNKKYLRDRTGNRRFWPVPVRHEIRTEWVELARDQLFAEAYALYVEGVDHYTPTKDEEKRLFEPMQDSRLDESAVDSELLRILTRPQTVEHSIIHADAPRISVNALIKALNVDIGKVTPALKGQIEAWLESNGWVFKGRQRIAGLGLESGVYFRPDVWPPEFDENAKDWTLQDDDAPTPAAEPEPPRPDVADGYVAWDEDDEAF